jgi:RNA polymerase-binding protein DksA
VPSLVLADEYDLGMAERELDIAGARAQLTAERNRLMAELGEPIEAPGQMTYGSQAAAASHVFEQQRDLALRDRSRIELGQVDSALRRVDDGSYGTCTSCGKPIAAERLEAIPWASLCIDCARKSPR